VQDSTAAVEIVSSKSQMALVNASQDKDR
jgi:hypothetical protein